MDGYLDYLQSGVITNKATLNIHVQCEVFVWTYAFLGRFCEYMFNFLKNFKTVFQSSF